MIEMPTHFKILSLPFEKNVCTHYFFYVKETLKTNSTYYFKNLFENYIYFINLKMKYIYEKTGYIGYQRCGCYKI